jgi:hypothetical protein
MAMDSIERFADEIKDAAAQGPAALSACWVPRAAASVLLTHVPPAPTDGPVSHEILEVIQRFEAETFLTEMPDLGSDDVDVTVDRNVIRLSFTLTGTRANGDHVNVPMRVAFTVADDLVVEVESDHSEPEKMAPLFEMMTARGLPAEIAAAFAPADDTTTDPTA